MTQKTWHTDLNHLLLPDWHTDLHSLSPPDKFYQWLTKPNNIGAKMRLLSKHISLKVLFQNFAKPYNDEISNGEPELPLIRKIYLLANNTPWSFGRVIIPHSTYKAFQDKFDTLNSKLIGETLLYNDNTTRSLFEFAKLNCKHNLFIETTDYLSKLDNPIEFTTDILWSRRSTFFIHQQYQLMITEIYLPTIPSYPHAS